MHTSWFLHLHHAVWCFDIYFQYSVGLNQALFTHAVLFSLDPDTVCLNGGYSDNHAESCRCPPGFIGPRCEDGNFLQHDGLMTKPVAPMV